MNEAEAQRLRTENEQLRTVIKAQGLVLEDQGFALHKVLEQYDTLLGTAKTFRNLLLYAREVLSDNGIVLDSKQVAEIVRHSDSSANDDLCAADVGQIDDFNDLHDDTDEDDDHVEDLMNWPRYDRKWIWSD